MTEQEKFEADVRAAVVPVRPKSYFEKLPCGDYADPYLFRSYLVWQQQRARHKAEVAELVAALNDAAQSLRTISKQAGKADGLIDVFDVRGYANSRAGVAFAAIAKFEPSTKEGNER